MSANDDGSRSPSTPKEGAARQSLNPSAFSPGVVVAGKYEITGKLGEGGMGVVFEARHLKLGGRLCALKFVLDRREQVLARFEREAEIVARLAHPGIVQIFDVDSLPDGQPFIVMERLSGQSLRERMSGGLLSWPQAFHIATQIADTLAVAHDKSVIHRDLKPDNIFLCDDGAVKVLDFGVAQLTGDSIERLTATGQVLGTLAYMAPEQILNRPDLDGRVDQYALGAMLYEAITGVALVPRGTPPQQVVGLKLTAAVPTHTRRSDVPAPAGQIVDKAIDLDRDRRFKGMTELAEALRSCVTTDSARREVAIEAPPSESAETPAAVLRAGPDELTSLDRPVADDGAKPPSSGTPATDGATRRHRGALLALALGLVVLLVTLLALLLPRHAPSTNKVVAPHMHDLGAVRESREYPANGLQWE